MSLNVHSVGDGSMFDRPMFDATSPILAGVPSVLAERDFDWFKLVPFAIAVVIWIVGAIAKSIENATKRPPQPRVDGGTNPPGATYEPPAYQPPAPAIPQQYAPPPAIPSQWSPPPSLAVPPAGQWAPPPQWGPAGQARLDAPVVPPAYATPSPYGRARPAPPPLPTTGRKPKRAKQQKMPAVPPIDVAAVAEATSRLPVAEPAAPRRPASATGPALDAAGIRRWLSPATLKQQYILTELFDPPPSARADQRG